LPQIWGGGQKKNTHPTRNDKKKIFLKKIWEFQGRRQTEKKFSFLLACFLKKRPI
jgi:hypothetical protein